MAGQPVRGGAVRGAGQTGEREAGPAGGAAVVNREQRSPSISRVPSRRSSIRIRTKTTQETTISGRNSAAYAFSPTRPRRGTSASRRMPGHRQLSDAHGGGSRGRAALVQGRRRGRHLAEVAAR